MRKTMKLWALCATAAALVVSLAQPASADPDDWGGYTSRMVNGTANIPGDNTKWVPQGLSKDGEDTLIISYYDSNGVELPRIFTVDRASGITNKWFKLNVPSGCHVGGIATTQSFLWVACTTTLVRFTRASLNSTQVPSGSTLYPSGTAAVPSGIWTVNGASYAFGQGETVWVGRFKQGWHSGDACPVDTDYETMWQYKITNGAPAEILQTIKTPARVQGVAISNTKFVWSTSCGSDKDSKLIIGPARSYDTSSAFTRVTGPNMSEGMVIAGDHLQQVFESGSTAFDVPAGEAKYRIWHSKNTFANFT